MTIQVPTARMTTHDSNIKTNDGKNRPKIDCHRCTHYFVTWQPSAPHGCRGHGFKSRQIPSVVVQSSSGMPCLLYKPKR